MVPNPSGPPVARAASPWWPRVSAAALSVILFALGAAQPALVVYNTGKQREDVLWGFALLLAGWVGAFLMQFGWFANPMLLFTLTLLLMGRYRRAFWVGVATVLIGLSTLSWYVYPVPADESISSNRQLEMLYPTLGFYFWMGSLLVGPVSALILAKREAEAKAPSSRAPVAA